MSIHLRNAAYDINAFRYYQYFKNKDSPYDVLYSDIKSWPQGIQRQELQELHNDYLSIEQQNYKDIEIKDSHYVGELLLGYSEGGYNFKVHRRLLNCDEH